MCIAKYRTSLLIILFIKFTSMDQSQENLLPSQTDNIHHQFSSSNDFFSQRQPPSVESDIAPENEGILIKNLMQSKAKARYFRHGHSLKGIAHAIKFLLESQGELHLKDLSCLLFELVCQTEMGTAIANGYLVEPYELQILRNKYANESKFQPTTMIRNVKRRFYDVLNVMIASQTLTKHKHLVRLTEIPTPPSYPYGLSPKDRLQQLQSEFTQKQTSLKKEKKKLKTSAIEFLAISKMVERNLKEQEKVDFLDFPLVIAFSEANSKTVINYTEDTFQLSSKKQLTILGEKMIIPELFKPTNKEVNQFLNDQ